MMDRINLGKRNQRKFIDLVIMRTNSPNLRGLIQFGIVNNYSTLKNYHNESRLIPEKLFLDMCEIAKINLDSLKFQKIKGNWGQVKGGRIGKRDKSYKDI